MSQTLTQSQQATPAGMESFAALFEESLLKSDLRAGEVISAEVVRIEFNHVVVNAGQERGLCGHRRVQERQR